MDIERVDFLIIGAGVAGLRAAVELAPHGSVMVLTKDVPTESASGYAQGGVAVALSDEDTVGIHYEDTLRAGDGLCNEGAVRILVEEGPERIKELISWGAEFDREGTKLAFGLEAAHTKKRVLHAHGDATGRELVRTLINKVRAFDSVRRMPYTTVTELIVSGGQCHGAYVLSERRPMAILARATVLATGGAGQVYSITTNPQLATADGAAIAYRAGAELVDMEFVQFHPTALYYPAAPHFLLSEAMRGEGGRLLNVRKERFMERYHPDLELAPRDVVSRSIISEMVNTSARHVYLDMTHLEAGFVRGRFPRIYDTCLQFGVDITAAPIPVCPAAHYMMGGVKTDSDGATSIAGLYAAGEVACTGIHGANRLASNSLLEGLVFGARAGGAALSSNISPAEEAGPLAGAVHTIPEHDEIRGRLRRLMWDRVGIIRCAKSLNEATEVLRGWDYILDKKFLTRRELELKNMLQVAGLITRAALERKGSVGAHYRSDFAERGESWKTRRVYSIKGVREEESPFNG
jgi:L-aspartate oxidase